MLAAPIAVRRLLVVAVVLIAMFAVVTPGSDTSYAETPSLGSRTGFSPGGGFPWMSDDDLARELDLVAESGARWLRIDFDWSGVEHTRGRYNWDNLDRVVGAARSRGLEVLALLAYTPAWARPAGTSSHHPPTDPDGFAAFAAAAAERYTLMGVTHYEIWNEPNIPNFWEPKPDVPAYAELLKASAAAIRAAAPGAKVVSGGLSPSIDSSDGRYVDPRTFLDRLYELGAGDSFDAFGVHPYSFPALPSDVTTASWNTFQKMTTMRQTMISNGDGAKKIWLTETGAPTGTSAQAVSEEQQAAIVSDTLQAVSGLDWTGPVFLYAIRDAGDDKNDREDNFGLVRRDYTPKLAWEALTTALQAAPPAPRAPEEAAVQPAQPDELAVDLTGPRTGDEGEGGNYGITVTNGSRGVATGFTVVHSAGSGQRLLSVSAAPGSASGDWACVFAAETSCTWIGELASGQTTPAVTIEVAHEEEGEHVSTARLTSGTGVGDEVVTTVGAVNGG